MDHFNFFFIITFSLALLFPFEKGQSEKYLTITGKYITLHLFSHEF